MPFPLLQELDVNHQHMLKYCFLGYPECSRIPKSIDLESDSSATQKTADVVTAAVGGK